MAPNDALNLMRFKKSTQGLIELVTLIEQAETDVRHRILTQLQKEDVFFYERVTQRLIFFEDLICLNPETLGLIISEVTPKILAHALQGMPETFREELKAGLSRFSKVMAKDEEEMVGDVAPALVQAARRQILKKARALAAQGKIEYELER